MPILLWIALLFALSSTAYAQVVYFTPVTFHSAATATGNGTTLPVDKYTSVGVQVVISDTATVTFEATSDGTNWVSKTCASVNDTAAALVTTATASGVYQCNIAGLQLFRARISAYTAGTVTVTGRASTAIVSRGGSGSGSVATDSLWDAAGDLAVGTGANTATRLPIGAEGKVLKSISGTPSWEDDSTGTAGWPSVLTSSAETSEASYVSIRGTGANNVHGFDLFTHSNGTPTFTCVVNSVRGNCDWTYNLNAGYRFYIRNSSGTIIFAVDEATGYAAFEDERHFRVASCNNATASAVFDLPTANAPAPTCEGTNTRMATLDFDATTDESFADSWTLPASFQGSIDVHFRWKAASTTGAVGWCAQLVRVPDGATSDPALPAQAAGNCVSDTAKGTTLQENVATITGVTCTSCVAGDRVNVVISRDANGGAVTDDMTGDAKLITYGRTIR